jgi:hypothetical protein
MDTETQPAPLTAGTLGDALDAALTEYNKSVVEFNEAKQNMAASREFLSNIVNAFKAQIDQLHAGLEAEKLNK